MASRVNAPVESLLRHLRLDLPSLVSDTGSETVNGNDPASQDVSISAAGSRIAVQSGDGGRTVSLVDLLAGYGAVPFGHNHPALVKAARETFECSALNFGLPGVYEESERLAALLSQSFARGAQLAQSGDAESSGGEAANGGDSPLPLCLFANSGAEGVEAALKLARAHTQRLPILSTLNAFHGKTLGALSATGRPQYQRAFGAPCEGFFFVPFGNAAAVRRAFEIAAGAPPESAEQEASGGARPAEQFAALVVEPVQGEGGIILPPDGYMQQIRELCSEFGVALIFDEVQTGLGRTGAVFAANWLGVCPDILVTAKALSGGICPVSAILYSADFFSEYFLTMHSSTFAGNSLAMRVGCAVVSLLSEDDYQICQDVAQRGAGLLQDLHAVRRQHPELIREVRGRGFLIGVEFGFDSGGTFGDDKALLRVFSDQGLLAALASAHMLNVSQTRAAVALNSSNVLRIEPPLNIPDEDLQAAAASLSKFCEQVSAQGSAALLEFGKFPRALPPSDVDWASQFFLDSPFQVVFLVALSDTSQWGAIDNGLRGFSAEAFARLHVRLGELLEPFIVFVSAARSVCVLPRTYEELASMDGSQRRGEIGDAVELVASWVRGQPGGKALALCEATLGAPAIAGDELEFTGRWQQASPSFMCSTPSEKERWDVARARDSTDLSESG
jgi:acetylornithine/succinyldiaminopimelate/putrescine aminotransferase